MPTFKDLSEEQQSFIKKYIKVPGLTSLFTNKKRKATDQRTIDSYWDYDLQKRNFDAEIAAIPVDLINVRLELYAKYNAAEMMALNGLFDGASATMAIAVTRVSIKKQTLEKDADTCRDTFPVLPDRADVTPADFTKLSDMRQLALNQMAGPILSGEQTHRAGVDKVAFEQKRDDAIGNLEAFPAALMRLNDAKKRAEPVVGMLLDLNISHFSKSDMQAEIIAATEQGKSLMEDIANVGTVAHEVADLANRLNAFADSDPAKTLIEPATDEIKKLCAQQYAQTQTLLEQGKNTKLAPFAQEPEYEEMVMLQGKIESLIPTITTKVESNDLSELTAVMGTIATAKQNAEMLSKLETDIHTRRLRADLDGKGAKGADQNGIVSLMGRNKDAAEKVIIALGQTQTVLNGQAATPGAMRALLAQADGLDIKRAAAKLALQKEQGNIETWKEQRKQSKQKFMASKPEPGSKAEEGYETAEMFRKILKKKIKEAKEKVRGLTANFETAEMASKAAREKCDAAAINRMLLDAVAFGPLSDNAAYPLPDHLVTDIADLFTKNPKLADETCSLLRHAKDPEALVKSAQMLADECKTGFANPDLSNDQTPWDAAQCEKYSTDILARVAHFGPGFAKDAEAAIKAGKHRAENPDFTTDMTDKQRTAIRTTQAATSMMQTVPDGKGGSKIEIDFNSPGFKDVMERQKFADVGQLGGSGGSPLLIEEIEKLQAFFDDPNEGAARKQQAEEILNSVDRVPKNGAARALLSKSMGIAPEDFDDPEKEELVKAKLQASILKAMVTPVAQGAVGSCFATAPLLNLRNQDPLKVMELYAEIAKEGKMTPPGGKPKVMPAVVNVQPDDDPLARSLEYTLAAASTQLENSKKRDDIGYPILRDGLPAGTAQVLTNPDSLKSYAAKFQTAWNEAFKFSYDPLAISSRKSADGSSSRGKHLLLDKRGDPIESEADFAQFVEDICVDAATDANLSEAEIKALKANNATKLAGLTNYFANNVTPWDMGAGGLSTEVATVLGQQEQGGKPQDLLADSSANSPGERAVDILVNIGQIESDGMTILRTAGLHAFNAVPLEGAVKDLMTGDVDANVVSMLIEPGKKMAQEALPVEKVVVLFHKLLDKQATSYAAYGDRNKIKDMHNNPPKTAMRPKEIEDYIAEVLEPVMEANAKRRAATWAKDREDPPSSQQLADKELSMKQAQLTKLGKNTSDVLAENLPMPEFVIADANWGDATDHTLFVIAPNPVTGTPAMWKKSVMTGKLTLMDDRYLNADWGVLK